MIFLFILTFIATEIVIKLQFLLTNTCYQIHQAGLPFIKKRIDKWYLNHTL